MSRSTRRAPKAQPAQNQPNNADLTANAADSTAAKVGSGADIPDAPNKPQADQPASTEQLTQDGANGQFEEPGSTLNPSDPNAPNYRFEPVSEVQSLAGDQSIDQGTGVQPPSPVLAAAPAGGGTEQTEPGVEWSDENTPRGRVITVTKGGGHGGTTTREEVLPHGATDDQAAAAKSRLAAWLTR